MNLNYDKNQKVILDNAKVLEVNQITKLISLNDKQYVIESTLGKIKIEGENLEVVSLDLSDGKMKVQGIIYLIEYLDLKPNKQMNKEKSESFFKKVFK